MTLARTMRRNPEQQLHIAVAQYLNLALPERSFWTTIPSGGGGRVRGALLKAMGLRRGVPDLMVIQGGRCAFIELKAPGKHPTLEQRDCHDDIKNAGAWVFVCRSIEDVERLLRSAQFQVCGKVVT